MKTRFRVTMTLEIAGEHKRSATSVVTLDSEGTNLQKVPAIVDATEKLLEAMCKMGVTGKLTIQASPMEDTARDF